MDHGSWLTNAIVECVLTMTISSVESWPSISSDLSNILSDLSSILSDLSSMSARLGQSSSPGSESEQLSL